MSKKIITFYDSDKVSHDFPIITNDYGICDTDANTVEKVVTCDDFSLFVGAEITVKFNNASTTDNISLNVNNTGAISVDFSSCENIASDEIKANGCYGFVYDGTSWVYKGSGSGASKEELERLNYYGDKDVIPSPDEYFIISNNVLTGLTDEGKQQTEIIIPYNVTHIDHGAFGGCTNLINLIIPKSVTTLGEYVFDGCTGLKKIIIPESITYINFGDFSGCTNLTSIILPDSITGVSNDAFRGCTSLKNITLPNSTTYIGGTAFQGCSNLTSIVLPKSITQIDGYTFKDCTSLKSIYIPSSVMNIYEGAFHIYDSINKTYNPIPGLTIYCEQGSYADTYAKENNIPVVYTDIKAEKINAITKNAAALSLSKIGQSGASWKEVCIENSGFNMNYVTYNPTTKEYWGIGANDISILYYSTDGVHFEPKISPTLISTYVTNELVLRPVGLFYYNGYYYILAGSLQNDNEIHLLKFNDLYHEAVESVTLTSQYFIGGFQPYVSEIYDGYLFISVADVVYIFNLNETSLTALSASFNIRIPLHEDDTYGSLYLTRVKKIGNDYFVLDTFGLLYKLNIESKSYELVANFMAANSFVPTNEGSVCDFYETSEYKYLAVYNSSEDGWDIYYKAASTGWSVEISDWTKVNKTIYHVIFGFGIEMQVIDDNHMFIGVSESDLIFLDTNTNEIYKSGRTIPIHSNNVSIYNKLIQVANNKKFLLPLVDHSNPSFKNIIDFEFYYELLNNKPIKLKHDIKAIIPYNSKCDEVVIITGGGLIQKINTANAPDDFATYIARDELLLNYFYTTSSNGNTENSIYREILREGIKFCKWFSMNASTLHLVLVSAHNIAISRINKDTLLTTKIFSSTLDYEITSISQDSSSTFYVCCENGNIYRFSGTVNLNKADYSDSTQNQNPLYYAGRNQANASGPFQMVGDDGGLYTYTDLFVGANGSIVGIFNKRALNIKTYLPDLNDITEDLYCSICSTQSIDLYNSDSYTFIGGEKGVIYKLNAAFKIQNKWVLDENDTVKYLLRLKNSDPIVAFTEKGKSYIYRYPYNSDSWELVSDIQCDIADVRCDTLLHRFYITSKDGRLFYDTTLQDFLSPIDVPNEEGETYYYDGKSGLVPAPPAVAAELINNYNAPNKSPWVLTPNGWKNLAIEKVTNMNTFGLVPTSPNNNSDTNIFLHASGTWKEVNFSGTGLTDEQLLQFNSNVYYDGQIITDDSADFELVEGTQSVRCTNLTKTGAITVPYKIGDTIVTGIANNAFENSSCYEVIIPNTIISIGVSAFKNATNLMEIRMPDSITSVKESAFEGCSSLNIMHWSDNTAMILANTFKNCAALSELYIGEIVHVIDETAFNGCTTDNLCFYTVDGCTIDTFAQQHNFKTRYLITNVSSEKMSQELNAEASAREAKDTELQDKINEIKDKTLKTITFKNLLNVNDENYEVGKYVNPNTGKTANNTSYNTTGYISVYTGDTICLSVKNSMPSSGATFRTILPIVWMAFYDDNKAVVKNDLKTLSEKAYWYIPEGVKYVRISFSPSDLSNNELMVEKITQIGISDAYIEYGNEKTVEISLDLSGIDMYLPPYIYAVKNREFDIYTPAMFGDVEPRNNIKRIGYTASGFGTTNFAKRFIRITPTGTIGQTIHLKGLSNGNSEIASAFTKIVTKNPTTATKTILAIGDSLTDGKPWIAEIMRLNPNYTFVGSYTATKNDSEGNSHTFKHDGRSGWRAEQYYTGYGGENNKFYDGNSFNFSYYVTNTLGGTAPDIVNIFLGMNDMERDLDSAVNYEKLIVDNIRSSYPNMPVIICAPQARDYNKESNVAKNGYLMMKKLYETFSAYQNLYFVPLYLLHDSENNYKIPDEYESVNPRSSIMTNKISDTVHPQDAGYWQIADAIFAALCAIN